jgi:hypothetical protein
LATQIRSKAVFSQYRSLSWRRRLLEARKRYDQHSGTLGSDLKLDGGASLRDA